MNMATYSSDKMDGLILRFREIRSGEIDAVLVDYIKSRRYHCSATFLNPWDLEEYIEKHRSARDDERDGAETPQEPSPQQYPNEQILEFLARLSIEEYFLIYASRFPQCPPEQMARALEFQQVSSFCDP